jgi:hypothetical protein
MSHPDEGTIQMLLDGELGPDERARIEAHALSCASCAARIDEARAFMQEADRLVDVLAVPARMEETTRMRRRRPALRSLAWAASIVLAVGLGYFARGGAPTRPDEAADVGRSAQVTPTLNGQTIDSQQITAPAPEAPAPVPSTRRAEATATTGRSAADEHQRGVVESKIPPSAAPSPPAAAGAALEREDRASRDAATPAANAEQAKTTGNVPAEAAAAGGRDEPVTGWRVVALEEAVRILDGQVRLIDGLSPERVETGPGTAVAGADPTAAVVRVVYASGTIVLDEQREGKAESDGRLAAARAPQRALAAPSAGWRQAGSIRFAVTGSVSADSLRALADRVR